MVAMIVSVRVMHRGGRLVSLAVEALLNVRIFLIHFDLLYLQWNAEPLRKIAFGNGEITRARIAGIEMLVIPEVWRRDDGSRFPFELHGAGALQMLLAEQREALAVEREDDGFVRVPVPELVRSNRKIGHVRLENGVAGHFPEHAGVARAALFPRDYF